MQSTFTRLKNLLLDSNSATAIREMTSFHRKRLRNPHACCCEQDVQRLLLSAACLDELCDCAHLERGTLLFSMLNDGQVHYFGVPFPVVDRFAVWTFQGFH